MPEIAGEDGGRVPPKGGREPIGVPWGRVGRQVLAFILVVAGILLLFEYFTGVFR